MKRSILLVLAALFLAIPWSEASAGTPSLIPGTGIPVAPALSATISPMPSPAEQELITALNTVLALGTLSSELVAIGLDRAWWAANLEVTLHHIPYYLSEGREYDMFVDLVHPPTGDQTGCYARTGTTQWTCIDSWGPSSSYPLVSKPADFVDSLFPVAWSMSGGSAAGSSLQWNCMDLRAASGQADAVEDAGRIAGGLAAAGGAFAGLGALMGATSAAIGTLAGAVVPAGMVLAPALVAGAAVGLIVAGVVVAAIVAGHAARRAYEAGTTLGLATSCPGCGDGYDPKKWRCTSNPASDLCTCTPIESNGEPSEDSEGGSHGGSATATCSTDGPKTLTIHANPWDVTCYSDASGCTESESHQGVDNASCESCGWYTPPEDILPTTGGSSSSDGASYGCDVCVAGDSPSIGEVTCWSITSE